MATARLTRTRLLAVAATLQGACGLLLAIDVLSELPELRRDPAHALLEAAIVGALLLGSLLIVGEVRRLQAQNRRMRDGLRAATGAFVALLEEAFRKWNLTPAERDVALLAIKGFSVAEIATLRAAAEGTVRAQCAAVYRKAGVSGRPQLISHFIDDLLAGIPLGATAPSSEPRAPLHGGTGFP
jgi:DNA-binding CsgD family transcriptional regulator